MLIWILVLIFNILSVLLIAFVTSFRVLSHQILRTLLIRSSSCCLRFIWLKLLITYIIKLLKHVYEHGLFSFNICLICISDKVHINLSIASFLLIFYWSMEWIFLIKLIEVFITYFGLHSWNIWCSGSSYLFPIHAFEEWMGFDLFGAVLTESAISITNHPFQNIC